MEALIQLIAWIVFGIIGFKMAEKYNEKHNADFDPKIWAAIGFLCGLFGLAGLAIYAYFKLNYKKGDE